MLDFDPTDKSIGATAPILLSQATTFALYRAAIFSMLCTKQYSCHCVATFSRPRNVKRSSRLLYRRFAVKVRESPSSDRRRCAVGLRDAIEAINPPRERTCQQE